MSQTSLNARELTETGGRLRYCKAYRISDLAEFAGWPSELASGREIAFLHEDFRVTLDPWGDPVDGVDPELADWREFCKSQLKFFLPDDVAAARPGP
jgi:hypothetical protein